MSVSRSFLFSLTACSILVLTSTHAGLAYAQQSSPVMVAQAEVGIVERLMAEARDAIVKNELGKAVQLFERVIIINPNQAEALYQLSIQYFQAGRYEQGLEYIQRAIVLKPDKIFLKVAYAKALAEVGRNREAIRTYQEVLEIAEPGSRAASAADLELNILQFKEFARQRDYANTERVGRLLLKQHFSNKQVLDMVGNIFANLNMLDQAEEVFLALISTEPNHPLYNFYLAGVYDRQRRPLDAEKHYQVTVNNAPHSRLRVDAQKKLALLRGYKETYSGDKTAAKEHFEEVLKIDPNNVPALMAVAGIYYEQRDIDAAIEKYEKVIEIHPQHLDAHFRLSTAYLDRGRFVDGIRKLDLVVANSKGTPIQQTALQVLEGASKRLDLATIRGMIRKEDQYRVRLRANPRDTEALLGLAQGYLEQGRTDEGEALLLKVIETDSSSGEAYTKLGRIYQNKKEYEQALVYYQAALVYVSEAEPLAKLQFRIKAVTGFLAFENDELDEAEENLLAANDLKGGDRIVLRTLAGVSAKRADLEQAAEWYMKVLEYHPDDIGTRMNVAFIYERLEEEELAIAQYRQVVASKVVSPEGRKTAEQRIDYIQRQTNGVSFSVGYSLSFDDNLGGSRNNRLFEYRSDTFGSLNYRLKLRKGMKFSASITQAYSIYHKTQSDYYSSVISPSLLVDIGEYDLSVGVSRSESSSVLRPEQSATVTDTFNSGLSWSNEEKRHRMNFNYRGFGSQQNTFFDSESFNLGYNVSHPGPEKIYYSYGYTLSVSNNRHILGSDNAYTGHGVNGRVDRRVDEKLSGFIDASMGMNFYKNEDSFSGFQELRRTLNWSIGTGMNYALDSWVSLYANYRFSTQYSNLPVGFILTETQAIESSGNPVLGRVGLQSASLGSFTRNTLSTGVRMNF